MKKALARFTHIVLCLTLGFTLLASFLVRTGAVSPFDDSLRTPLSFVAMTIYCLLAVYWLGQLSSNRRRKKSGGKKEE